MKFEKLTPNDIDQIASLQPDGWSDITAEFRFFLNNSFCYPIKLIVDNEIAGVGNSVTFNDTAWLAHIIVGNEYRNRGFGFQIVKHLLNDLSNKSINSISLIASPYGEPVYKKFGFRTVSDYIYLERRKPWTEKKLSHRILPYKSKFYSDIIQLDKKISGEEREPLIKEFIESSFVYIDHEIKGFYIPTLGEGQIFANTTEAGIALMSMKYVTVDTAVIPINNQIGLSFLEQNGFCESETKGKRMIIRKEIDWQPIHIFSRISGDYG